MVRFIREEVGQDLIEYTLLLGLVVVATALVFVNIGADLKEPWNAARSKVQRGHAYGKDHGSGNPHY
ncbi:MAG TPA: hypothetical protein VFL57_04585 [Bryobacteraceae bacterium]|nr:hypothetical protein [Bryobacteraceae bacterium]